MTRTISRLAAFVIATAAASHAWADDEATSFAGSWKTTFGEVALKQDGDALTGTFGPGGRFTIKGTAKGRVFTADYQEDQARGELSWTLDPSGHAFSGTFAIKNGRSGTWKGWRPDPAAASARTRGNFAGLWLTDLGLMDLTQDGAKVSGKYATRGGSPIEGTVTGRHLEFTYTGFRPGVGWFDLSEDGKALSGAGGPDGWFSWTGRSAPEYARNARLEPGKSVDGSTSNLLTYTARAPEGYKDGDARRRPTILILHGSNMSGRAYVETIANAWPDIAKDYLLLGINGESPSRIDSEGPAFNYSYINFVGKSTYKGFPGTDRESPALVSEALADLAKSYPIGRVFVGGHSQGGFLTYSLLMNFPDQFAGAFPISCGLIFQCEPSAYADEALKAKQRSVPLAIIHGRNDPIVGFGMGEYAASLFPDSGWPAFRFFADDHAGHMFARLPVALAIRWLEVMSSDDPNRLLDFAERRIKDDGWRDAIAAVRRAKTLKDVDAKPRRALLRHRRPGRPRGRQVRRPDLQERRPRLGRRLPLLPRPVRLRRPRQGRDVRVRCAARHSGRAGPEAHERRPRPVPARPPGRGLREIPGDRGGVLRLALVSRREEGAGREEVSAAGRRFTSPGQT